MDSKSFATLELPKILERLAGQASFSAGAALARSLTPTDNLAEAQRRQQETSEARKLLAVKTDVTIGGARDVRPAAVSAARGGVLTTGELMDIKSTLIAARNLRRTLVRLRDQFPRLAFISEGLAECPGIVEAISRTIDERGEVFDSASEKLAGLRRELRTAHDRLLSKLQAIIGNSRNQIYLQEPIITQRDGRYVIPIKADFKGRIRGIVHDQSASGATLFIEPLSVHDMANTWRSLQLQEMEEIRRILAELSALIGAQATEIGYTVDALADLDLAFAKAKYADTLKANEPELRPISNPQSLISNPHLPITTPQSSTTTRSHPGTTLKLVAARHPLLDQSTVVPVDVVLGEGAGETGTQPYALVITGPNTGGKTVSLKTVGLLVLMAQAGLHIPAQSGSALSVFEDVFADIGDEQSIEQSLSTFSAHVTNIIGILKKAGPRSLVILDELGAGTDPGEGSALARAILSYLLDVGATTLVATHYPELKVYAHTTPGVANASVEFDLETLAPTYHLTIGLPGRSNAFAIASRLGLDQTIIDDARTMVTATDQQAETLLDEIHRQREIVRAERAEAEAQRARVAEHERKLAARLDAIDTERQALLDKARAEAQAEVADVRAELDETRRRLRRLVETSGPSVSAGSAMSPAGESAAALAEVEEKLEALEDAPRPVIRPMPRPERGRRTTVRLGDTVFLPSLNAEGQVIALTPSEAEVQVGRLRVRAKLAELVLREQSGDRRSPADRRPATPDDREPTAVGGPSPGLELDMRGQSVEDGLAALERYLDAAYLAGLPWVRIIHGKGTGKLRQAVRDELRRSPLVKSHESGADAEGGEGVTVARLALAD